MFDFLSTYAQLINIGLLIPIIAMLIPIIGLLVRVSRLSRTALVDKHEAELAAKELEVHAKDSDLLRLSREVTAVEAKLQESEHAHQKKLDEIYAQYEYQRSLEAKGKSAIERITVLSPDQAISVLNDWRSELEEQHKEADLVVSSLIKDATFRNDTLTPNPETTELITNAETTEREKVSAMEITVAASLKAAQLSVGDRDALQHALIDVKSGARVPTRIRGSLYSISVKGYLVVLEIRDNILLVLSIKAMDARN